MPYQRRIVDDALDELFPHLAAIALEGAKGVGKTATAIQRAATVVSLDDPAQSAAVAADIDYIAHLPPPVLLDEWQLYSAVWDRVRRAVDDDNTGGQFLLTGSAGAHPEARIHSGAGRIVSIAMRPLSLAERGLAEPAVSLAALLSGAHPPIAGQSPVGLMGYTDEILRSGFPGIRNLPDRARQVQLDSYVTRIVERDLKENGIEVRRPDTLRSWLTAYAAATATDASYTKILDAATGGDGEKPRRATMATYRDHLMRLFILDPLPAWIPTFNPLKRLTQSPKHHLVDPALAARLVGVGRAGLLRGEGDRPVQATGTWLGALFESLAAQSIRVYAGAASARTGHLRTRDTTREIDLIIEGDNRRVVAVDVKLAEAATDHDVRHLNWLHAEIGDRLADKVLITSGKIAYRRRDGVAVVPLALLGP